LQEFWQLPTFPPIPKSRVCCRDLCYTLFISFKLDNWFCVVPLAADPVMGLVVFYFAGGAGERSTKWMSNFM
jgi:hypothetical protein